jgi:D-lactate dehydrogenase
MKVAFFSTKPYEKEYFDGLNATYGHEFCYFEPRLSVQTAAFAEGCAAVCIFVNDDGSAPVLRKLADTGVRLVALRCAGFNNVDLKTGLGLKVVRVPAYSPYAVAEHTVALIMTLNRKTHRAFNRVREGNYSLNGLVGFDLHGKTVGLVGTGKIGLCTARILAGFGCRLLGYDVYQSSEFTAMGGTYTSLEELYRQSDILSLHTPLTPQTFHMINARTIGQMKDGVMIINTSRGKLIDTKDLIEALKAQRWATWARRVRGGGRPVFRRPLQPDDRRRSVPAAAYLPQRAGYRSPGLSHPRGPDRHRPNHPPKPFRLRSRQAAGQRSESVIAVISPSTFDIPCSAFDIHIFFPRRMRTGGARRFNYECRTRNVEGLITDNH